MEELIFPNIADVLAYLQEGGWKVKKSTLYVHVREGRLRTREDSAFHEKDIAKYAKLFLKRLDLATMQPAAIEKLQKRKIELEAKKLEAQVTLLDQRVAAESGRYCLRADFERELALHAAIFRNDIETFCLMNAPEIVHLVNGSIDKIPDLINYLRDKAEDWLNTYSEDNEWEIIIDPDPQQQEAPEDLDDVGGVDDEDDN